MINATDIDDCPWCEQVTRFRFTGYSLVCNACHRAVIELTKGKTYTNGEMRHNDDKPES